MKQTSAKPSFSPSRNLRRAGWHSEYGMSMIEMLIAVTLLFIVSSGLLGIGVVATTTTENQGHLSARATEYAQDKLEQLMSLAYGDGDTPTPGVGTDTTVFPACNPLTSPPPTCTTGSGLYPGGFANPSFPQNKYVDWLDVDGNLLGGGATPPANWYYVRVWQIVSSQGGNVKQITVTAAVRYSVGSRGRPPQTTVATLRTRPF